MHDASTVGRVFPDTWLGPLLSFDPKLAFSGTRYPGGLIDSTYTRFSPGYKSLPVGFHVVSGAEDEKWARNMEHDDAKSFENVEQLNSLSASK